jgi:hypothetical protein
VAAIRPSSRSASAERHGRDHEPLVVEPLADLPQARLRHLFRIEAAPRIDLHAADSEIPRPLKRSPQVAGESHGGDGKTGRVHRKG